jgi:hypothetical protein
MAKKAKKAKKAKSSGRRRPRPKVGEVRKEMKRLRNDLSAIIRDEKDQQGDLDERQLKKAKKTKEGLDDALKIVLCIQSQAPY